MRFSIAALVAGFAATSSAFLLPPHVGDLKDEFKDTRFRGPPKHFKDLIHSLLEEKTTTVDLECPGCPYAASQSEDGAIVWEQDVENVLHLEFDTRDKGFNVNGYPLLPLDRSQQSSTVVIKAHQLKKDAAPSEQSIEVPLSFAVEFLPSTPSPRGPHISMIPVEFTVVGIENVPVKVNTVTLKLIQIPDQSFAIVNAEQIPFHETPGAGTCEGARAWTFCRVKAIIADRISKVLNSTKDKANKVQDWVSEKTSGCGKGHGFFKHPRPQGDGPDGEHPHRHHWNGHKGQRHGAHRLGRMLHKALRLFVIPALLGVIGGLAASAIGMLVGQAIIHLWFRTYRNGQRGPLGIYEREIALIEEEQVLLNEGEEDLPKYEDAPKYEETLAGGVEAGAVSSQNEKQ